VTGKEDLRMLRRVQTPAVALDTKPDMLALREICDGKGLGSIPYWTPETLPPEAYTEIPICGKRWWEDGTQYECLMDKGHREQKHGLRGMVQRMED
jgi:hypothetical protein